MKHQIELPARDELCDPLCFSVEGWVHGEGPSEQIERLEVHGSGRLLGQTRGLGVRSDVNAKLKLSTGTRTGFSVFCQWTDHAAGGDRLELRAHFQGGAQSVVATIPIKFTHFDHRTVPFGSVLDETYLPVLHREHVYTSGPSQAEGSWECLQLLKTHLPSAPSRILDVGCGLGFYGRELRGSGFDWLGVEMKEEDCQALVTAGLPHRRVDGKLLPFDSNSFDAAMAIEVLEHVAEPDAFLRETARVAPRLFISVPNFEIVPYLGRNHTIPWHLLEADHKNFFTRWSLHHLLSQYYREVEVGCYNSLEIQTLEGNRLYYNLFASASR